MKRLPKASLAALAACVLVLGACGDDDDNNDDPTEDTSTDDTGSDDTDAPSDDTEAPSDDTEADSDDTEAPSDDTDVESEDTSDSGDNPDADDFVRDSLSETLGLSEEQVDCLLDKMDLSSGQAPDISDMQNYFEDCDINAEDIDVGG